MFAVAALIRRVASSPFDIGQGEVHKNEIRLLGSRHGNALRSVGRNKRH
jgi:hypothetical protein